MAPLAKIPAERPGVLVCTPLCFALAMGAGSPSGRLFFFSPSDWNRTPSLQSTPARAVPNLIVLT